MSEHQPCTSDHSRELFVSHQIGADLHCQMCGARWPCIYAAQATIAQRDAQVAALEAERDRLRARTHELQEKHDAETRGMKKQVARYRDLFSRAGDALKQSRDGYVVIPSAWDSAMFGVLTEQLAARDAQVAELTAALSMAAGEMIYQDEGLDWCRICDQTAPTDQRIDHAPDCPFALLARTPAASRPEQQP